MTEICRICLDSSDSSSLISPCACKGSQKFVHRNCLQNWQETTMDSFLTRPSRPSFANLHTCQICKTPYKTDSSQFQLFYLSPHVKHLWDSYSKLIYISLALLILASFYLNTFLLLLLAVLYPIYLCFKHKMRPQINYTSKGYRIGLIMIGKPVRGLASGMMLHATQRIGKGIFAGSKVLITEYSLQQAVGFIVNKGITIGQKSIKFGGPVKITVEHILHNDPLAEGSKCIVPGLYYGGRVNLSNPEIKILKVNGHAEWRSLQLDGEITAGSWKVLPLDNPEEIFSSST